ncbi:MAG: twin-arginine translocase subunit TatC [Chitinophagaceae bacterium]|nr:twin-arginine translocase subunit TatC [Chitinophagaceae bacterium]
MTFVEHLEVLRWHLVRSAIVLVILAVVLFINVDWVFDKVIFAPANKDFFSYKALCNLSHWLHIGDTLCMPPINLRLLGDTVSGPFMSALSISFMGAVILAFPYLLWEIWRFVKPALTKKEIRYVQGSFWWVSLCFFIGAAFGYLLLAPFTFNFLANFELGTMGVYDYKPTLHDYIDTLTSLILGCGLAFEMPIIVLVLSKIGIITPAFLKKYRRYAIVGILVLAAVITPSPDWISQVIVGAPLILLYEISIMLSKKVAKEKEKEEKQWE